MFNASLQCSLFLLLIGIGFWAQPLGCWLLIGSQLAIFVGFWKQDLSGLSAFTFMYCLFFCFRPAYIFIESDTKLLTFLFHVSPNFGAFHHALMLSSLGLICFVMGGKVIAWRSSAQIEAGQFIVRQPWDANAKRISEPSVILFLSLQMLSLMAMFALSASGQSLYGSAFGAYIYELPNVIQGIQIFCVIFLFEKHLQSRSVSGSFVIALSGIAFCAYTILARSVSIFRGSYVTGLMIVGLAVLFRFRGRVSYKWLVIPVVLLLPMFQWFGQNRGQDNKALRQLAMSEETAIFGAQQYWGFFSSDGDMNIFDTFVAALESKPAFYPYVWSWIYVPFHLIPRKIWAGKPQSGITQDLSYIGDAPYSAGIVGFFLRDGGRFWMLGSMFVLGGLICCLDLWAARLRFGYFKFCCFGILVVNAMFLTRFFLWQYAYQVLYTIVPCYILSRLADDRGVVSISDIGGHRQLIPTPSVRVLGRGVHSVGRQIAMAATKIRKGV